MLALLEYEERQNTLKKESEINVESKEKTNDKSNEKSNENTIEYYEYTDDDDMEDDLLFSSFFGCCIMYRTLYRSFFNYDYIKN